MSGSLHARCKKPRSVFLQSHSRERSRRRALQDRAVLDGKESLMAGAFEAIILRGIVDSAGKVCALLAVGDVLVFSSAHHDAAIFGCRIGEQLHAADRNLTNLRDLYTGKLTSSCETRFQKNPQVSYKHAQARER